MVTLGTSVISEAPGKFNLGSRKPEDTTRWIWAGVLELWAVVCGVLHVGRHIFFSPWERNSIRLSKVASEMALEVCSNS